MIGTIYRRCQCDIVLNAIKKKKKSNKKIFNVVLNKMEDFACNLFL